MIERNDGVRLFVPGTPAPKGSRTPGRRRDGSVYTRPASKAEHPWVEAVARVAMSHRRQSPASPYAVHLVFFMPRPTRPTHAWPSVGDIDKLERAVLDGLVRAGVLEDDRHVVELGSRKVWAPSAREAGVHVDVATALAYASEAA